MNSKEILSINLKFYRKIYNLSQEKFAEIIGSNIVYINQLENCKRKPTIDMLDIFDASLNITASDLIKFDAKHITNFSRIDEKIK